MSTATTMYRDTSLTGPVRSRKTAIAQRDVRPDALRSAGASMRRAERPAPGAGEPRATTKRTPIGIIHQNELLSSSVRMSQALLGGRPVLAVGDERVDDVVPDDVDCQQPDDPDDDDRDADLPDGPATVAGDQAASAKAMSVRIGRNHASAFRIWKPSWAASSSSELRISIRPTSGGGCPRPGREADPVRCLEHDRLEIERDDALGRRDGALVALEYRDERPCDLLELASHRRCSRGCSSARSTSR